jgi:thiamine biosynthesis lipoprotein
MKFSLAGILFYSITVSSCNPAESLQYHKISGFTQGTSYHITYGIRDTIDYQPSIDSLLRNFDLSLSAWEPASVLSRINRNETDSVDEKFTRVYEVALDVYGKSGGAFDLTVMPLVNAWGFGPDRKLEIDRLVIDSLLGLVGMEKIKLEGSRLIKTNPNTSVDVNAIAQGYSVDLVALFLESKGCQNYMVEIGGEVRTKGRNPKNAIWKIGIDRPDFGNNIPGLNLQAIVELDQKSLATSGNYRKYYEEDGEKFTHSIDPKTGYPAKQQILSVTIVTEECIYADALATAVMVLGLEKGKEMISGLKGVDAYLIFAGNEGEYQVYATPGFEKMLAEK